MVIGVVADSDVGVTSLLEEHLVGDPSFAFENLHGLIGCGVVEEGFSEDVGVQSPWDFFDFGEEG